MTGKNPYWRLNPRWRQGWRDFFPRNEERAGNEERGCERGRRICPPFPTCPVAIPNTNIVMCCHMSGLHVTPMLGEKL